ncbi:MAG: hypothetical protein M3O34_02700 [Chloroflexota bacterium]|nr:hypothetical protein [Chloroflexota bacterium]
MLAPVAAKFRSQGYTVNEGGMNEAARSFDDAGLVAVSACGHWWTYSWRMTLEQLHEVLDFHRITVCPFCEVAQDSRRGSTAPPTISRVN